MKLKPQIADEPKKILTQQFYEALRRILGVSMLTELPTSRGGVLPLNKFRSLLMRDMKGEPNEQLMRVIQMFIDHPELRRP